MAQPRQALDLDRYLPFYWTAISNRWTATASRTYLGRFGVGVVEWRVLAVLAAQGPFTSLEVAKLAALDAGAASRAMNDLLSKGLVQPIDGRFTGRSKPFEMTEAGVDKFEQINVVARERTDVLLQDLSADEQDLLLSLLRRIHTRLANLNDT